MEIPFFKAHYGTFDMDMEPLVTKDISTFITDHFKVENNITIPHEFRFGQHYGDPAPGSRKFIQIRSPYKTYNISEDDYQQDIHIGLNSKKKHIKVIYYIYVERNSNWQAIVSGQLSQIKSYGILDEAELHVHITDVAHRFDDVISIITAICKEAIISTSSENLFEYPGIKLVYDLAKQDPESVYIYFHTKGMSYHIKERKVKEITLLRETFISWRKSLEAFYNPEVNKIGLFPGIGDLENKEKFGTEGGWIWYNFWYARGSYIVDHCLTPTIKSDRYYFEVWLAGPSLYDELKEIKDCFCLYSGTTTKYVDAMEAWAGLNFLSGILP